MYFIRNTISISNASTSFFLIFSKFGFSGKKKRCLEAVLNLLSDCFKAAFARSFPLSISGLFRSISALLSHLFRHIARYAP